MPSLRIPFRFIALFITCAATACGTEYAKLKKEAPPVHDYPSALAAEYLSFAESEFEQRYWAYAEHFARKGRNAMEEKPVPLEDPGNWRVDGEEKNQLLAAKATLDALLSEDIRHIVPQKAARAHLLYDCWVVQASRRAPEAPAYPCQEELDAVVQDLQTIQKPLPEQKENP